MLGRVVSRESAELHRSQDLLLGLRRSAAARDNARGSLGAMLSLRERALWICPRSRIQLRAAQNSLRNPLTVVLHTCVRIHGTSVQSQSSLFPPVFRESRQMLALGAQAWERRHPAWSLPLPM